MQPIRLGRGNRVAKWIILHHHSSGFFARSEPQQTVEFAVEHKRALENAERIQRTQSKPRAAPATPKTAIDSL